MAQITKIDLINDGYSAMKISGLTVDPTPEDINIALMRLEGMAAEYEASEMCTGYIFTNEPDPNDYSGVPEKYRQAFAATLALRLAPDFGKEVPQSLYMTATGALSTLSSLAGVIPTNQYPARQPVGSGNSYKGNRWRRYFTPVVEAPNDCATNQMTIGEVNDFTDSWDEYIDFDSGETIDSYTTVVTPGITMSNDVLSSPDITYRVTAVTAGVNSIKFTVTTSAGRVDVRYVNFEVIA